MKLILATPEKEILHSAEVVEILAPAQSGQLGILPHHAPLISALGKGQLQYRLKTGAPFQSVYIEWGTLEVQADHVVILAESARSS